MPRSDNLTSCSVHLGGGQQREGPAAAHALSRLNVLTRCGSCSGVLPVKAAERRHRNIGQTVTDMKAERSTPCHSVTESREQESEVEPLITAAWKGRPSCRWHCCAVCHGTGLRGTVAAVWRPCRSRMNVLKVLALAGVRCHGGAMLRKGRQRELDGWMDDWMDGRTDGRMDGRTDGRMIGWDGWSDGVVDGGGRRKWQLQQLLQCPKADACRGLMLSSRATADTRVWAANG